MVIRGTVEVRTKTMMILIDSNLVPFFYRQLTVRALSVASGSQTNCRIYPQSKSEVRSQASKTTKCERIKSKRKRPSHMSPMWFTAYLDIKYRTGWLSGQSHSYKTSTRLTVEPRTGNEVPLIINMCVKPIEYAQLRGNAKHCRAVKTSACYPLRLKYSLLQCLPHFT